MDYLSRADSPDWPIDAPDHVFLARACAKLGKAMFGEKWGLDIELPDDVDDDSPAFQEWEALTERAEIEGERMIRDVQDRIAAWARAGHLKMALRAKEGGSLVPQSADIWNTERYLHRFAQCEMSLHFPFRVSNGGTHFIFVEAMTLEDCLREIAPQRQTARHEAKPRKRSRKLDAAIEAIRKIAQGKKTLNLTSKELLRELNQILGKDGPASLTTVMRARRVVDV